MAASAPTMRGAAAADEAAATKPAVPGGAKTATVGFVSGCYDVLHGGHVEFFTQARALVDRLVVSVASEGVLAHHKAGRRASMPTEHKVALISALRPVDEVVVGEDPDLGLDFKSHFLRIRPNLLIVTEDDKYGDIKRALCEQVGARYLVLPKTPPTTYKGDPISTTAIIQNIRTPSRCPLRVDFGGGWLDVPSYARPGSFIVNCAVSPLVSLGEWRYRIGGGLGGSAAHALLSGRDPVASELDAGVGWQDPAVIHETGLCVWRSGPRPVLDFKTRGDFLRGRMAVIWTGSPHVTPEKTGLPRSYNEIEAAGAAARAAVLPGQESLPALAAAVAASYNAQLGEGMAPLPAAKGALARKYCGGGWGGYALYLFVDEAARAAFFESAGDDGIAIEPYTRE